MTCKARSEGISRHDIDSCNEAKWRIYASLNYAIIESDNALSPVRRQGII